MILMVLLFYGSTIVHAWGGSRVNENLTSARAVDANRLETKMQERFARTTDSTRWLVGTKL